MTYASPCSSFVHFTLKTGSVIEQKSILMKRMNYSLSYSNLRYLSFEIGLYPIEVYKILCWCDFGIDFQKSFGFNLIENLVLQVLKEVYDWNI
jgi:hypothetical protein